ncbi:hypothetical protein ACVWWK_006477 [Bradyrhizobium sp. LB9.1b]
MDASQVQFECALEAGELDALSGLVAEVVPVGSQPRPVPFTAPLLLFARLDGSLRRRLFADHPGRVLVQEQLLIECRRAPKAGEPIQLSAEVPAGLDTASLIEISGRLTTSDGETIVVVRVGLRHIAGAAIDHLAGFALERLVKGETTQSVRCGPISDGLIARYVKICRRRQLTASDKGGHRSRRFSCCTRRTAGGCRLRHPSPTHEYPLHSADQGRRELRCCHAATQPDTGANRAAITLRLGNAGRRRHRRPRVI